MRVGLNPMSSDAPRLSIVIPAYNEGDNLQTLVEEIESGLAGVSPFEVIIVDDGSCDRTDALVAHLMFGRAWLRVERHDHNRGQSAAIWTGVAAAHAPIVAVLDGDGQNDPSDIPALLAALESSGAAMVTGERRQRRDAWIRRLSSRIANGVRSTLLRDGIRDTGCGLKVFRRRDFLELPRFDHMHRFLPALFQQQGSEVRSMPVNHRPRRHGTSKYGIGNRLWVGLFDLAGVMWLARRRI
jgi:dolichol-phosphate mannosyltransferase